MKTRIPTPLEFFEHLRWLDGKPLLEVVEPYRQKIFRDALFTFDEGGYPQYNFVLAGRGKKNWKTADLILAALYRFTVWPSKEGNDSYILANDEDQAADDLSLAKKLISVNPLLEQDLIVRSKEIERADNGSRLAILPAKDVAGSHGKTYLFIGFDEIHEYRNYDLMEALAPDPTRRDVVVWVTSYNTLFNRPGIPLYDLIQRGKAGTDPRMYFSWYAADYVSDPSLEDADPEEKANPSMQSWGNPGYLEQQRQRLPSHKYRRLHLNLPGMPEGTFLNAEMVMNCTVHGRRVLRPQPGKTYSAFVDMSGGSSDDSCLAIGHKEDGIFVVDLVEKQAGRPPFDPRRAVTKFARILEEYGIGKVTGDKYAGQTFRADFEREGVSYETCPRSKHQLYEALEPRINAGEVELPDIPILQEQLLGLVVRGQKIDHGVGGKDDHANVVGGLIWCLKKGERRIVGGAKLITSRRRMMM